MLQIFDFQNLPSFPGSSVSIIALEIRRLNRKNARIHI
ncbi:hypothetical protein KNP414_03334 [Paenibacillus mucilaginosus KNP414]|uniref:Uncharacterized protein n=1 Tax=Paenibacillus mucilaginosus (strain KNP414) TaxID=1036673 RepID=F8F604_PAEMK|nr:hypothetical protein KNP414_03334 [Paenibacillus mucilaginosus KNP414]